MKLLIIRNTATFGVELLVFTKKLPHFKRLSVLKVLNRIKFSLRWGIGSCVNRFLVLPGESLEKREAGADNSLL